MAVDQTPPPRVTPGEHRSLNACYQNRHPSASSSSAPDGATVTGRRAGGQACAPVDGGPLRPHEQEVSPPGRGVSASPSWTAAGWACWPALPVPHGNTGDACGLPAPPSWCASSSRSPTWTPRSRCSTRWMTRGPFQPPRVRTRRREPDCGGRPRHPVAFPAAWGQLAVWHRPGGPRERVLHGARARSLDVSGVLRRPADGASADA